MTPDIPGEVLLRARSGDPEAFRAVAEAVQKLAYNIAWRMTYHAGDAEDAAQEILLRLHRNFPRYDPALPFLPWFRRLAINCAINCRTRRLPVAAFPGTSPEPAAPDARLRQAIRERPADYRACVTLKYLEDLGVAEISEALGVPPGTVKTWLFRAREILLRKLKPHLETIL